MAAAAAGYAPGLSLHMVHEYVKTGMGNFYIIIRERVSERKR